MNTLLAGVLLAGSAFSPAAQHSQSPFQCIYDDDVAGTRKLLQTYDPQSTVSEEDTVFSLACASRAPKVLELLLRSGAKLDHRTPKGITPLMRAVDTWNHEAALTLLDSGADPNRRDKDGCTALHHTVNWTQHDVIILGREDALASIVEMLAKHGADLNARDKRGRTALMWAAGWQHMESFEALLHAKANVNAWDTKGRSALTWCANEGYDSSYVKRLIKAGARVRLVDALLLGDEKRAKALLDERKPLVGMGPYDNTLLMLAAQLGDFSLVKGLIKRGAQVQGVDERGFSALHFAVGALPQPGQADVYWQQYPNTADRAQIIAVLVRSGINPNVKCKTEFFFKDETPLDWAAAVGKLQVAKALLAAGAYPDGIWSEHKYVTQTPLAAAIWYGHLAVAKALLDAGANPNSGRALILAFSSQPSLSKGGIVEPLDRHAALRMLLAAGADPNFDYNWSPLEAAIEEKDALAVTILLGAKANPDAINPRNGKSVLIQAVEDYDRGVFAALRNFYPNPNLRDQQGRTAKDIAAASGNKELILGLEQYERDWRQMKRNTEPKP